MIRPQLRDLLPIFCVLEGLTFFDRIYCPGYKHNHKSHRSRAYSSLVRVNLGLPKLSPYTSRRQLFPHLYLARVFTAFGSCKQKLGITKIAPFYERMQSTNAFPACQS